jgi:glycosyltransferase involved in cell wall biosynthesis
MKRKVCFLIPGFSDGGAQKQCILLLNELQRHDDLDLTVIFFHVGVHYDQLAQDRLRVIHLPPRSSNYDPRNLWEVWKVLRKIRPDLLFTWLQSSDVYGFFLRRTILGMRWLMTERDSSYPNELRFRLRRMLGRFADGIVANSASGRQYWQHAQARGRLFTVNNIVPVSTDGPQEVRAARVVTIGRLEPQKNARTVIEAFVSLALVHADVDFAVIGAGNEEAALKALVAERGMADRIDFMGFRRDVPAQLRAARLAVSMSHHEGLPNVMLESVAAGTLVVASDIPEHRELFGETYPYYVIERTDPTQVAATIEAALSAWHDTGLLAHARARVEEMAPATVAARYRGIFAETLGGRT